MEWLDKILQSKKNIRVLYVIFIIGVLILGAGSFFPKQKPAAEIKKTPEVSAAQIEERLAAALSEIHGVGKAVVLITFENNGEIVPAVEKRESSSATGEKGMGGETKNEESDEKPVILSLGGGSEGPMVLSEISPKVRGVIVAAEGGGNPEIKENIREAVRAVLGVPPHNIQVFKKRS